MYRFMLLLGLGATLLAACAQRPESPLTQAAARNDVRGVVHDLVSTLKLRSGPSHAGMR